MAQPSQINYSTRVFSARLPAAQSLSLDQELIDRGMNRQSLIEKLLLGWLRAVTGRGYRCTCPNCPGNMSGYVSYRQSELDLSSADMAS